jgi:ribosomal protein S18 acetylase RimI-like enzyme
MTPTPVRPARATPADVDAIHALRRSLEDWMAANGTVQWQPGSLPRERIAAQVEAGEWHVVRNAGGLVGTVRLLWSDPDFWGPDQNPAVYVHGLMVDRRHTGAGVGTALLDWAQDQGRAAGADVFRLDCRTTNPVLRRYYEAYGFTAVGQRDFADFSCTLLELDLRG